MARPIALVTGASSGIGERIALRLASSGNDLVLVARRGDELARVAALDAADGAACETIVADLSQGADVAKVEARIADDARPIEILVNNAGYGRFGKITELDGAGEANEIAVNVTALSLCSALHVGAARRGTAVRRARHLRRTGIHADGIPRARGTEPKFGAALVPAHLLRHRGPRRP